MTSTRVVWLIALGIVSSGCAPLLLGAGAAGAATAYEVHNKHELNELEKDRESGRISAQDYRTRKDAIEDQSLVY